MTSTVNPTYEMSSRRYLRSCCQAQQHELIPRLTDMVSACKGVVEHRGKLWGELTEAEGNIVAARVGVIAHEIIRTGQSAETGQTLR